MLVNREVILAKVESTYNTDAAPATSADEVLVENLNWAPEGARMNERAPVRSSIGKLKQLYGGALVTFTFDTEIKGSGAAGTAPEIGPLFEGCAMGETVSAGVSVAYSPVSTSMDSLTMWYYQDGTLIKMTGGRGNYTANLEAGVQGKISWTFTGHLTTYTDVSMASPSYLSTVPVPCISVPFAIGGYSAVISALTFDMSNQIATPPDISASDGYSEVRIIGRDVQGSFDPEGVLVATNDYHADWVGGVEKALTTGAIGSAAGNIYQVDMPVVAYRNMSPADRDGVRTYEMPFGATESSGDDEITFLFT